MAKLAVLDIGTNSIHLVLAEVEPDFSFKVLDRFKEMARLGDGVFATRRLSDVTIARGVGIIRNLVTLAHNKGYERIDAVATSAVREAKNGGEFIEAVERETGLTVRVVTGEEEARLIYLGVRHSMDLPDGPTLIVDVGGGSVELVLSVKKMMKQGHSLKLGAIRLKDLFLSKHPPSRTMLGDMQELITAELLPALEKLNVNSVEQVIATSGMAGNLAEVIHLRRTGQPLLQLNLARISVKDLRQVEGLLARSDLKARLAIPGLDAKRVDTLLPAAAVLRHLSELVGVSELTISDKAIREGLIYDFIEQNREGLEVEQQIPNVRRRQVVSFARRCQYPEGHAQHVATLALELFDQTKSLHGLGDCEREWLEYAAILHDIGYLINDRRHHKHTYYLIMQGDLHALRAEEVQMIAAIARYHRRALPHRSHEPLKKFSARSRRTLDVLSALLRIADGLDRSHFAVVQSLRVKLEKPTTIVIRTSGDPELELWAARGRADLFEKVFKCPVQFKVQRVRGGQG